MKRLVFGCGFLGLPVAEAWSANGDEVFGMTRKQERFAELEAIGIRPLLGDITKPETLHGLPVVDTVLVAVGMDRSSYSDIRQVYVHGLQNILDALPAEIGHLMYVSSTGVYGDSAGRWVDEQTEPIPLRDGGKACLAAEQMIKASPFQDRFTILRFAGLYGNSRIPMQAVIADRQWGRLSPTGFLNLIHVEDGVRILLAVAKQKPFGETFLVSDGNPVCRKDYYEATAEYVGCGPIVWPEPSSSDGESLLRLRSDKRISNVKLRQWLDFEFQYPNFQAGLEKAFRSNE